MSSQHFFIEVSINLCLLPFRAVVSRFKNTSYCIEHLHEPLSLGMKASKAYQEARRLFQRQRHNPAASDEIEPSNHRSPADTSPGLIGEISCNLMILELLMGTEELRDTDRRNFFLNHLWSDSENFDFSMLFHNCQWEWRLFLNYILGLFKNTQECFLTLTRKFCYGAAKSFKSFKNLAGKYKTLILSFQPWTKMDSATIEKNSMSATLLRPVRQSVAASFLHSFGHIIHNWSNLQR